MKKKRLVEAIEGYARANVFLEEERIKRLARLTPEEARGETLIAVRRAFELMAKSKGLM